MVLLCAPCCASSFKDVQLLRIKDYAESCYSSIHWLGSIFTRLLSEGFFISQSFHFFQVSLRDPLRAGAEDMELREIIGAAVC